MAAVLGVLFLAAGCIALLPRLITLATEFDGNRRLSGGYSLSMLKGFPRTILGPGAGGSVCIPAPPTHNSAWQVGGYAELDLAIVGELEPFQSAVATRYFIIDLTRHTATEFNTEAQWHTAMKAVGIDPMSIRLQR